MQEHGYNDYEFGYSVIVTLRFKSCLLPGHFVANIRERKESGDGQVLAAAYMHRDEHQHTSACEWHSESWKLADRFFGVGYYRVRLILTDRRDNNSRPRYASRLTTD